MERVDDDGVTRSYRLVEVLDENGKIKMFVKRYGRFDKNTREGDQIAGNSAGSESSARGRRRRPSELLTQADLRPLPNTLRKGGDGAPPAQAGLMRHSLA